MPFELGRSVIVRDVPNADLVIVAYGSLLSEAIKAQRILAGHEVEVGVVNARFAAPVDRRIVEWLEKGKKVITLEDHHAACGFASAVLELAAASRAGNIRTDAIRCLGAPRAFVRHDTRERQLIQSRISADEVVKAASQMLALSLTA